MKTLIYLALPCIMFSGTQALAATDFGKGRPVTAKDLAGKTICWSDGVKETFETDGIRTSSLGGHRKWVVVEPGLLRVARVYTQIEMTQDGRFHIHRYCGLCGGDMDWWGTPCS